MMSLLEDIFLRDEADEARELERIIEGDEYDEKPQRSDSDDNTEKDDEAEEEKKRVDPSTSKTKRAVKNPRFILNPARLTGPRGIQVIPDHFKDFKFKGKGHEKEDLDLVLKKLEHWAYRLYPKFEFEDCLKKIETLGKKRPVMVHLHKIRSDQFVSEETIVQKDSSDEETVPIDKEEDEFDKLLQQQIELARSTPRPGSVKAHALENSFMDRSSITAPKATSSPSISEEQKERMMRNRKLAEERRLARLKNISTVTSAANKSTGNLPYNKPVEQTDKRNDDMGIDTDNIDLPRRHNRSNVIDSSDDEDGITTVSEAVTVDIHADINMKTTCSNHTKECNEEIRTENDFDSILNDDRDKDDGRNTNDSDNVINTESLAIANQDLKIRQNENVCEINDISKNKDQREENLDNSVFIIDAELSDNVSKYSKDADTIKDKETNHEYISEAIQHANMPCEENVTLYQDPDEITDGTVNQVTSGVFVVTEVNKTLVSNDKVNSKAHVEKELDDDLMDVDFTEDF